LQELHPGKEVPKRWREITTEHEKELCHLIIQGVLEELGYESAKNW